MARLVEDNFSSPGLQRNTTTTYLLHERGGENLYPLDLAAYIHMYLLLLTYSSLPKFQLIVQQIP